MMEAQSVPQEKPQPDRPRYGIGELYLFREFTRQGYEQTFGVQPPPFDPSKPIKTWFDSSVAGRLPGEVVTYSVVRKVEGQAAYAVSPFAITAEDAARVNLPGAYRYPAYVPADTPAMAGGQRAINPVFLTERAEAEALGRELGLSVVEIPIPVLPIHELAWNGETRRQWALALPNGKRAVAGLLLQQKYAGGIGAPGFWKFNAQGYPIWEPIHPITSNPNAKVMPLPVRGLLPNERLIADIFGPAVVRTDLEAPGPAGSDEAWKALVTAALGRIEQKLNALSGQAG
jgi:hypothetical protein